MVGLLRAEWAKLTHQTTSWILALLLLGIAGLFPLLAMTNVLGNYSLQFRQNSYTQLNFLEGILQTLSGLGNLGVILVAVMISTVVGSEYALDTWKNLLTWQNGRSHFLVIKLAVAEFVLILAFALTTLLAGLFAALAHGLVVDTAVKVGLSENTRTLEQFFKQLYVTGLPVLLYLLIAMSLATLFTILGQATIVGIMVTLVWWIGENLSLRLLPDTLKNLTIISNIDSLKQNITDGKGSLESWQSLLLIGAYIVIPLTAALIIFQKRDIVS